jgi:hypothetical protein
MVELAELQAVAYIAQIVGVVGTLTAAFIAVRSYLNANKRAEEAKKKEQETRDRELETRQTQLFMSTMFDKLSSQETAKARALINKNIPKTVEEWEKLNSDPEINAAWQTVWWPYEGIGVLVHEGLLDIRLVARMIGNTYKSAWENWSPMFMQARVKWNFPRYAIESEYLYDRLIEFGKKHPEFYVVESEYKGIT